MHKYTPSSLALQGAYLTLFLLWYRDDTIELYEGGNANISCTSRGVPTPNISWTLNGQITPFNEISRYSETKVASGFSGQYVAALGSGISILQLINIQYPDHFGTYVCTGSNHPAALSSATIAVVVLGMLGRETYYDAACMHSDIKLELLGAIH